MQFNESAGLEKKFSSPEEEIAYLRNLVSEKHANLENTANSVSPERVILQEIENYKKASPEDILHKQALVPEFFRKEIALQLAPEEHDDTMKELYSLLETKGLRNTLDIVEKINDAHITDDFHRFLIEYLREGYTIKDLKEGQPIKKTLSRTLFEILVPQSGEHKEQQLSELFGIMEQFYMGMNALSKRGDEYITFEIANALESNHFVIYISVGNEVVDLFEKQLLSVFPSARINPHFEDFNIFHYEGITLGGYVLQKEHPAKPIKTSEQFVSDPMKVLLNVFSKINSHDEGAALQFVFKPIGDFYTKAYIKGIEKLEKGEGASELLSIRNTTSDKILRNTSKVFGVMDKLFSGGGENKEEKPKDIDSKLIEQVKKKIESPVVSTNIRIVASASDQSRASLILKDISSAFHQFENTQGNSLVFNELKNKELKRFFDDFTFRNFEGSYDVPLSVKECSTMFHLPQESEEMSAQLKTSRANSSPSPMNMTPEGAWLGINKYRGVETNVYMNSADRLRHFYVIGQTGTGKSTLLKSMAIQDIKDGNGLCFIDPHGNDVQEILSHIPKERYEDLIYFDPAATERPFGLNMLEFDESRSDQKTFVVDELLGIFKKLYASSSPESMGPAFEQYFRNSTLLVMEDPESGNTLVDISRVLSDKKYRDHKISKCKNPLLKQFWINAEATSGEQGLANYVQYVTNKFDVFLSNEIIRPIIAQEKSSINFREVMDNKKILLVNLSKGRLGDINSNLIGLILVGKFLMAALSRVDSFGKGIELPPYYLYIDEFHNLTTPSISTILSEARKYKLGMIAAHQHISQLEETIKNSVFGNVGSMAVFRVSTEDAKFLEPQFAPTFTANDLMNIENLNCFLKLLHKGMPEKPFNLFVPFPPPGDTQKGELLKQKSYLTYGRQRDIVEKEIMDKFLKRFDSGIKIDY
jgi:hypothetical protein